MDICPYGATDDDNEGHDPKWLQEACYRVPVADVQSNANWHTMTRAAASSKAGFDTLKEICQLDEEMTGQDQRFMLVMRGSTNGATTSPPSMGTVVANLSSQPTGMWESALGRWKLEMMFSSSHGQLYHTC
uniref:Uncharacterized protein n=1 Tax=Bionectria ochroleuca TaxID=29856 RepID=A0A8H7N865_BIOOC